MKRIYLNIIGAVFMVALIAVNFTVVNDDKKDSEFLSSFSLNEAIAWGFMDGVENSLQGQGWTKDEREVQETCPSEQTTSGSGGASGNYGGTGGGVYGSGSSSQSNPSSRTDIRCAIGTDNCTSIDC